MTAETDAIWAKFERSLVWQPIDAYDRAEGHVVLLRGGNEETIGYWNGSGWWHAQESLDDQQLSFKPAEFAVVNDEWRTYLMAD